MQEVLLYSQKVSDENSMFVSLGQVLMPILQDIHFKSYPFKVKLFITSKEILYIEAHHPEENVFIRSLVQSGKLEMLTGTYSNLNVLLFPSRNISEDIERMSTLIRKYYKKRPSAFFPYENVIAPSLVASLYDAGLYDMYTAPLSLLGFRHKIFNYSDVMHTIRVNASSFEKSPLIALNLDDLSLNENALIDVKNLFKTLESEKDTDSVEKKKPFFSLKNSDFIPAGCYNGKSDVNFLSSLYNSTSLLFSRLMYIRGILLKSENKKNFLKNKKHLDYLLYSLSDVGAFLKEKDLQKDYLKEKENDFYTVLEECEKMGILPGIFETTKEEYTVLHSKNIFALIDDQSVLKEAAVLDSAFNILENGYAFKEWFEEENTDGEKEEFSYSSSVLKNESDMEWTGEFLGVEISKEVHIRPQSVVFKVSIKNNEKKLFTKTYNTEFLFSPSVILQKNTADGVKNLRLKIKGSDDILCFSSTKPFSIKKEENSENDANFASMVLIKPRFNLKLKRGEAFDVVFTLRYEKNQGEQK